MPLVIVAIGVALLLLLMIRFKNERLHRSGSGGARRRINAGYASG